MTTYTLDKEVSSQVASSPKVAAVAQMFGLGADSRRKFRLVDNCKVSIEPGQVVYITGGSGTGKSTLLGLLKEQMATSKLTLTVQLYQYYQQLKHLPGSIHLLMDYQAP